MKKIKVLVVDDSLMFREILSRGISSDPAIEVVAKAVDPYDARDKIIEFEPDVMTCDIQMPRMDGIEFTRQLLPQYPLPVIIVSAINTAVFDAMDVGAVDFLAKPNAESADDIKIFIKKLIYKIKEAAKANVKVGKDSSKQKSISSNNIDLNKVIAIGASTGGTDAISNILKSTFTDIPGIVVVQHIPAVFSKILADRLNETTRFRVDEAKTGDIIEAGKVLIAPGGKHMRVVKDGNKYKVECFEADKVSGHRPSVDVLFESVAESCKEKAIGIILTGMGYDGAKGLLSMRKNGARTIGQDEGSSVVYGMPRVSYNMGAVEKQASLEQIPKLIYSYLK